MANQRVFMACLSVLILSLFLAIPIHGMQQGWLDRYGNVIANTASKKWLDGFGGWLIVTSDQDWREKWNEPKDGVPVFTEATRVALGEKITLLTLYKNPQVDENNYIDLRCDIKVTRPDRVVSYVEKDLNCGSEQLVGARSNIRVAYAIIDFVGELGDPYGIWKIEVLIKDTIAGVSIPLENEFELINTARMTKKDHGEAYNAPGRMAMRME